jgi:hypothetical protein
MITDTENKATKLNGEHSFTKLVEECAGAAGDYLFGITKQGVSATLRKIADAIDAEGTLPQKVSHSTDAAVDDFVLHTVSVTFATKRR